MLTKEMKHVEHFKTLRDLLVSVSSGREGGIKLDSLVNRLDGLVNCICVPNKIAHHFLFQYLSI